MNSSKYFCKICRRQCNDKDGFKCHLNSNWHIKNNEIYMKNPEAYIEKYSDELKYGFLDVLKRKDENNFYSVKQLYSEYIRMRDSIGLNSSKWNNLTDFVHDLEKEKLIIINEKNCEIFIKYNNPIQEEKKIKEKKKLSNIERINKEIEKIVEKNKTIEKKEIHKIPYKQNENSKTNKIEISLNLNSNFLGKKRK
jgi:DNA/RNA-binding protein KIN17